MSSRKQRAANRANAQKSTGPRTAQGQAATRYNALKHGIFAITQIMFDETAEDLAELAAEYHHQYSPANPKERFLVDTLIANEWRLRRMRRVEAELWEHATNAFLLKNIQVPACSSGDAFATASEQFLRLQRVINSCERNYHRALQELEVARAHGLRSQEPETSPAPAAAPTPQPQQSTASSAKMGSFRQTPQTPPFASPDAPADPVETQPSAPDLNPKPPRTA